MPLSTTKPLRAFLTATAIVVLANMWVGWRSPVLLRESSIDNLLLLEDRIAAYPYRDAVKVLLFGSSHAMHGLRPPAVARAFKLKPQEVFSLAIPSGSAAEADLLAARYLPCFPAARRAFVMVDERMLGRPVEARLRYLTRGAFGARWESRDYFDTRDQQWGFIATGWLPLADFAGPLKAGLLSHPAVFGKRLLHDEPLKASRYERLSGYPYPWGVPPIDNPPLKPDHWSVAQYRERARYLFSTSTPTPLGVHKLAALTATLNRHGVTPLLIHAPYSAPMARALAGHRTENAIYQGHLARLPAELVPHRMLPPLPTQPEAMFIDHDHMSVAGAQRMADWLARQTADLPPI